MSIRIVWAAACFATIMGFSRLAYGLLLPAMHASLGGGLNLYGFVAAANLAGYLCGALLATRLAAVRERGKANAAVLIAMCVAIAVTGLARDVVTLGVLRFLVGLTSGIALTLTLALAVEGIAPSLRGRAAAIVWAGGTAGMALAGAASLSFPLSGDRWRIAWVVMALVGAAIALVYERITRGGAVRHAVPDDRAPIGLWSPQKYFVLAIGYAAFGFGYIDVLTFFGAALERTHAASLGVAVVMLGLAGTAGAMAWGPLLDRFRSGVPVAAACVLCALGAFALTRDSATLVLAGALVLGVGFIGVPAMTGALVQQREPSHRYARAFASMTSMLGVGQVCGPFVGGVIAERLGTGAALDVGAAALVLAATLCATYRKPRVEGFTILVSPS